jgi:hypothetical protein
MWRFQAIIATPVASNNLLLLLILREFPNSCALWFLTVVICRRAMAVRASRRLIPSFGV